MEAGIWHQTAAIAQARKLMAEGPNVIDLGPASNSTTPRLFRPTQKSRVSRQCWTRSRQMAFHVSLDGYQPATQAYALSRGGYLNDIRGFPDAAFYPQLAKSSAKLVVMHSVRRRAGGSARRHPLATSWDRIAAFLTRIAALTGARYQRNPPCP